MNIADLNDLFQQEEERAAQEYRAAVANGTTEREAEARRVRFEADTARLRAHGCIEVHNDEEE